MKKAFLLSLLVVILLSLTGCNMNNNTDVPTFFEQPPEMNVSCVSESVTALKGTTTWYYEKDGINQGFTSDSLHPLDSKEYMPALVMKPSYISHLDPLTAYLQWSNAPDEVTVRCWSEECWTKTDSEWEDVPVNTSEDDFWIKLKNGNYIYEVKAKWNGEKYGGEVLYSFYTDNRRNLIIEKEILCQST